jgi:hypothetical protein
VRHPAGHELGDGHVEEHFADYDQIELDAAIMIEPTSAIEKGALR